MTNPLDFGTPAKAGWQRLRLKDATTWVNRGVAPTYSDHDTGLTALNQKCVRPDLTIDPQFGRPIEEGTVTELSPARLRQGDVVINSTGRGTLGRAALVGETPSQPLVADGHVTVVRTVRETLSPQYLSYLLGTDAFFTQANACLAVGATNQTELNREALRRMWITLPPLEEQRRIADYLDAETVRIDDLIAEQTKQQHLHKERFRSLLVASLIQRQPRPDWTRTRLKFLFGFERTGFWGGEPQGDADDVPCVRVADFDRLAFTVGPGVGTIRSVPAAQRLPRLLRRGDVLLEKSGGTGDKPVGCAVTYESDQPAICSNFIAVLRPFDLTHPRWAGLLLAAHYQARLNGPFVKQTTGIQNLDSAAYLGSEVWVPPPAEQRRVAETVDERRDRTIALVGEAADQLQLLQEHRQALITRAVTDGIDGLTGVA